MPYAAGVYTLPPGTAATTLTAIDSSDYNSFIADIEAAQNTARPIVAGGTGATSASAARTALGLAIGTDVLAYSTSSAALLAAWTAATAAGPASLDFAEDTDNGTSRVRMIAPAALAADTTLTLPSSTGTVALATTATDALGANGVDAFSGLLYGLTLSNNSTDATNDIDIAAGVAIDSTNAKFIKLAAGITKRLDAAWAVGTGNGGLDTGSIANTTYHMWLIMRSDTGVVDVLFSASASSPTMPANYDYKRRIGSIIRASATIVAFQQLGDVFRYRVPVMDVDTLNPGTSAVTATLSVPSGLVLAAIINAFVFQSSGAGTGGNSDKSLLVTALADADTTPATNVYTVRNINDSTNSGAMASVNVPTNTSAQVRYRMQLSGTGTRVQLTTLGWVDLRGK